MIFKHKSKKRTDLKKCRTNDLLKKKSEIVFQISPIYEEMLVHLIMMRRVEYRHNIKITLKNSKTLFQNDNYHLMKIQMQVELCNLKAGQNRNKKGNKDDLMIGEQSLKNQLN